MFLGWVGVGLFMLLAPTRFINFVHDYADGLAESRPRMATSVLVRVMGAQALLSQSISRGARRNCRDRQLTLAPAWTYAG